MVAFDDIFALVRIILFALIFVLTLLYAVPIICVPQFHHSNMLLTLNICISMACNALYWTVFYIMYMLRPSATIQFMINSCVFVCLFPTMLTVQVAYSFLTVAVNRWYCVTHHRKIAFRKRRWVLACVVCQWIFVTLVSLPTLLSIQKYCSLARWVDSYKLVVIVVLPALAFLITNLLIYMDVRSLSRRIQPVQSQLGHSSNNERPRQISRRDIHLLRHMIVMFGIFIGGWTPLFVLLAVQSQFSANPILLASLTIWCQLSNLWDIIDLFLYNHQLRKYLQETFLRFIH